MIFFDLDGTLHHQELAEERAALELWQKTPTFHAIQAQEFATLWAELAEHYFNRHLAGELTFTEQRRRRVQAIAQRCGTELSDALADERFMVFLAAYEEHWCLYPEVLGMLQELALRNVPLGIITNGDSAQQRKKLNRLGIEQYFDTVVISGEHKVAKPERRIFEIASELAGIPAEQCWYIGDRLDVDAEASLAAGFRAVWVNRGKASRPLSHEIFTLEALSFLELTRVLDIMG